MSVGKQESLDEKLEDSVFGSENYPCKPDQGGRCQCPRRGDTPPPPPLPFTPIIENSERLEEHIRNHYKSSVFNQCGTQELPEITGPPLKIFIKKGAAT